MVETMKIEVAPWIKEYVTDMDDLYSELTLEKLNDKACGLHREKLESYQELFRVEQPETAECPQQRGLGKPRRRGRKVLFKGEPGIGKTTLMKKITFDWAKGIFTAVSIVFFVFLKLVNAGEAIENVIINQIPVLEGLNITGSEIKTILESFGPRCLLILDGIDEHALGQNQDVLKIFEGRKYLFCNVIVTSRPHSTRDIEKYFPTIVSVEGFTEYEARKFASRILSERQKIDQVLRFSPGTGRDRSPLHNVPILLSFICLLVREDDIDLSENTTDIGEIYTRMVRCLYKKFTIRKGIEYKVSDFINLLKSLGKLALETLLSKNSLLKRKEVIMEVGEDAFDYGLLIGHEDAHKLIRDKTGTADIFVTFPHRTILEFLGSFGFVWRLCNGENVEDILGIDCRYPVFLWNPLFLQFCLWFLETSDECFAFLRKEEVYEKLVHYTAQLVDEKILDLRKVAYRFPALNDYNGYKTVSRYFWGVITECRKTRHLTLDFYFSIDGVFNSFQSNLMFLESVRVCDRDPTSPFSSFHDLNTSNELRINIDYDRNRFQDSMIKTIINHFQYLEKRFCVYISFDSLCTDSVNLESFFDEGMHVLDVSGQRSSFVCNKQLPLCLKLTHLSLRYMDLNDVIEGLTEAFESSKFPCLSHLSLRENNRSGFLPRLFRVQCDTLTHLNMGNPLDDQDIDFLTSVNVDSERSILPNLSGLALTGCPSFPKRLFEKPWMKIKSFAFSGPDEFISSLFAGINEDKLPNVTKLSIQCVKSSFR